MPEARTFRGWRLASLVAGLALLGGLEFSSAPRPTLQRISDVLQMLLALFASVACLVASRKSGTQARLFWRFLALGAGIWATAQAFWTWQNLALYAERLPAWSDFGFLAASVPVLLAFVVRPDRPRARPMGLAFDAGLVAVLALHAYAYLSLSYLLAGDAPAYSRWLGWLWYLRTAVVLAGALWLSVTGSLEWRGTYRRLLELLLFLHGGEILTNEAMNRGQYHAGLLDAPWVVPWLWLGVLALGWDPTRKHVGPALQPEWRDTRRGLVVAIGAVVLVPVTHLMLALWNATNGELARLRTLLTIATTSLFGALFLFRQIQLLRELEAAQNQRESSLRRSEERFQKAFTASPAALTLSTRDDGRYLDVNERCLEMLGYTRAEMLGTTAGELNIWIDAHARTALIQALTDHGRVREYAARFRTKTGELRDVLTSVELVELDGVACLLGQTEDMTERRKLEGRLVQSQRLESMGRLAGGIAHDFNNLLGVMLGYSSLVLSRLPPSDPLADKIVQIQRAGERAAALTRQLLAFSSRQVLQPEVIDLGALLHDTEKMLARLIGEDVELTTRVAPALGSVRADPSQIEQVLMNLVVNARDAMPGGGRLSLELSDVVVETALPLDRALLAPGAYVVLAVRDTGIGISEEVRQHLFEPFFTTKERGKGTGLGLATVHGIVEQSGGHIAVETALGLGTTFRVYLPRVDEPAPVVAAPLHGKPSGGSETILLVEDEEPLREMTREILAEAGYRVLEAGNGARALEVAAAHAGVIHLLLTDVVMPILSGPKTAERLALVRPETRVLFASGYTAGELGPHGVLDPSMEFVQKPFSPAVLVARVREVLDR